MVDETTYASLSARIGSAYTRLATRPAAFIRLTDLRPYVGGNREQVDEVLRMMSRRGLVVLVPESNQKTLTEYDRAAALRMGNQDKHLVRIG